MKKIILGHASYRDDNARLECADVPSALAELRRRGFDATDALKKLNKPGYHTISAKHGVLLCEISVGSAA